MQIRTIKNVFLFLLTGVIILSCNKRVNNDTDLPPGDRISIPAFGTDSTFEIATWNIEHFGISTSPRYRDIDTQITGVVEIIRDLDIDLYATQEIENPNAFELLKDRLDGYGGFLANYSASLKTGVIYKESVISILRDTLLFENDSDFPRPPLMLYVRAQHDARMFDFYLIVVHLKAFSDPASENRRRGAIVTMEQFIHSRLQQGGDPDYIIAGDWNDLLDDPPSSNVFPPFLNKQPQEYYFLTWPFRGSTTEYSYIAGNFESLIDHILVTASIDTTYNIETQILKIDQHFSQYLPEISDHRPVGARFDAF